MGWKALMQLRKAGAAQEVQGARLYASQESLASSRPSRLDRPGWGVLACRATLLEHLSLMQPQAFYRAVADDFSAVDGIIKKQLTSRVPLVSKNRRLHHIGRR
nr:hypothetical protein GCM10020185_45690 [Pseudomonas brassicacearum subsp. brassicacearum]